MPAPRSRARPARPAAALTILVVSDATGETAERTARSALVQFPQAQTEIVRRGHVRTAAQVRAVVKEATGRNAVILHTLVSDELRRLMLRECRLHGVDAMDLMGPLLDRLTIHLKLTPQEKPGLFRQLRETKSRQVEAVEFAFRHDDGMRPESLDRAEVVLVGASRTMKTPTMLFLAYHCWFAANVPLIPGIDPPRQLVALPPARVFCLVMTPPRLLELRLARAEHLGIPRDPYATITHVRADLLYAKRTSRDHRWREIDVSAKSVEEAAREIMELLAEESHSRRAAD